MHFLQIAKALLLFLKYGFQSTTLCHVVLQVFTNVSEKLTAFIYVYPEDRGNRFLKMFLSSYKSTQHRNPKTIIKIFTKPHEKYIQNLIFNSLSILQSLESILKHTILCDGFFLEVGNAFRLVEMGLLVWVRKSVCIVLCLDTTGLCLAERRLPLSILYLLTF